jgi:hypothetical protein
MKIRSLRDIERMRSIIGDQNADYAIKKYREHCKIWVFTSKAEVDRTRGLIWSEREFCHRRFSKGDAYTGICRDLGGGPMSLRRGHYLVDIFYCDCAH